MYDINQITIQYHFPYAIRVFIVVISNEGDLVLLEPWRTFEVIDSGIQRPKTNSSIVPLRMRETELLYEKDIPPTLSLHALEILRREIGNKENVKKVVLFLTAYQFDNECNSLYPFCFTLFLLTTPFYRRY